MDQAYRPLDFQFDGCNQGQIMHLDHTIYAIFPETITINVPSQFELRHELVSGNPASV